MPGHESGTILLHGEDGSIFEVICRNYTIESMMPHPGETVFTALGEFAISPSDGTWQLLPAERRNEVQSATSENQTTQWATAEALRTRAGEGDFLPEHMDLIDATLFRNHRKTSMATKLAIANETDLQAVLAGHNIPTGHWTASVRRLYEYIKPGDPSEENENVTLHQVDGTLWLSTAQSMVNVYHTDAEGHVYKLRETDVIYFDDQGNPQPTKKSKLRSSLGETGQITGNRPERPIATARRGLREELGLGSDHIARIISVGSLLRLKEAGHHRFGPIKAEDHTHYFRADLQPHAVYPSYTNEEYDASGKLSALIKLEWFIDTNSSGDV